MDVNKILGNFVGKKPIKQRQQLKPSQNSFQNDFDFKKPKPIKEFKLADKPIQVFNNNPIPSRKTIEQVYKRIPDDTNIPLQFMTREQYLKKYVTNQEIANGKPFCPVEKRKHIKEQKQDYKNIIGRYTTENNQYYKPAVVIFNDKNNLKNIKGKNFAPLVWHEFGHEYVEDKGWDMPIHKEEMFADKVAMNKILQKQIIHEYNQNKQSKIKSDLVSKNRSKPNKLMREQIYSLPFSFGRMEFDEMNTPTNIEEIKDPKVKKQLWNDFVGTVKRYPGLIKDIKTGTKKNIILSDKPSQTGDAEFTYFESDEGDVEDVIYLDQKNKNPFKRAQILKHELVHSKQYEGKDYDERTEFTKQQLEKPYYDRDIERDAQVQSYEFVGEHMDDIGHKPYYTKAGLISMKGYEDDKTEFHEQERLLEEEYDKTHPEVNQSFRNRISSNIKNIFDNEPEQDNESKNSEQRPYKVLWHAGNVPPSEKLAQSGEVFGFISLDFARGWKEKENKSNIYRFVTDSYDIDDGVYARRTPSGNVTGNDEFICYNVLEEELYE